MKTYIKRLSKDTRELSFIAKYSSNLAAIFSAQHFDSSMEGYLHVASCLGHGMESHWHGLGRHHSQLAHSVVLQGYAGIQRQSCEFGCTGCCTPRVFEGAIFRVCPNPKVCQFYLSGVQCTLKRLSSYFPSDPGQGSRRTCFECSFRFLGQILFGCFLVNF